MQIVEFEKRVVAVSPTGGVGIPDSYGEWEKLKAAGWTTEYRVVEKRPDPQAR